MEQSPILPFERNRYYSGKLLTSTDFQAEQRYLNNKRYFFNRFVLGQGVVCGLSVFNLDDFSIMLESGVAIDGLGREIVVDSTVVKKLSTIEGFESLKTDRATLCLRYREEETQPVYTLQKESADQEFENNRISEGYDLSLIDSDTLPDTYSVESEFYSHARLFSDDAYTADIFMPSVVSCASMVKLVLRIQRHVEDSKDLTLNAVLQTPSFLAADGRQQLEIHTGNIHLEKGEIYESEFWLQAQKQENSAASIIAKAENIRTIQGGQERIAAGNFTLRTAIKPISSSALITREIGKMSLEMRQLNAAEEFIRLAEFHLVRTENSYVIDGVSDAAVKRYIALPAEEHLRAEYGSFYRTAAPNAQSAAGQEQRSERPAAQGGGFREPVYASGVCEIPLGVNAKRGAVFYSGELLHGLGRGDVYVEVGMQYLKNDKTLGADARNTIYGDAELFHEEERLPIIRAATAVKVQNDKGSFVVAIKLLEDTAMAVAEITWNAVKLPRADGLDYLNENKDRSIATETATVSLAPGENHFFHVQFKNMDVCSLSYTLTEENSGEISRDGIYTAPAREGIYEIKIACAEAPTICTYAYAVVKKRSDMA